MSEDAIGIIGTGPVGLAIARKGVHAGLDVLISSSRSPEDTAKTLGDLATDVRVGSAADAAAADIVFLAIPFTAVPALAKVSDWSGRIVVDATNQFAASDPYRGRADLGDETGSEWVAHHLAGAIVVKSLNTLYAPYIDADPVHPAGRQVAFLAGDDEVSNGRVGRLLERFGFAVVPVGGLRAGGRLTQLDGYLNGKHFLQQDASDAPVE